MLTIDFFFEWSWNLLYNTTLLQLIWLVNYYLCTVIELTVRTFTVFNEKHIGETIKNIRTLLSFFLKLFNFNVSINSIYLYFIKKYL